MRRVITSPQQSPAPSKLLDLPILQLAYCWHPMPLRHSLLCSTHMPRAIEPTFLFLCLTPSISSCSVDLPRKLGQLLNLHPIPNLVVCCHCVPPSPSLPILHTPPLNAAPSAFLNSHIALTACLARREGWSLSAHSAVEKMHPA